jgi:hypothetical protein
MLKKLLWPEKNRWQLIAASVGACLGLFLLLAAIQMVRNFNELVRGNSSGQHYVVVNKKVSIFNTLGAQSTFTESDIDDLLKQPFVYRAAAFHANTFRVSASFPGFGFSTELFFEALPDDYLDVDLRDFHWEEGDKEVPIILARDYLALYNFGFATSQGLPQFSPTTIRKVRGDLRIGNSEKRGYFKARVVGFSDRINSILVPLSFLDWANKEYGRTTASGPSRLIMEIENPMAVEFLDYLDTHQFELSSGRLIGGEFSALFNMLTAVLAGIGLLILLLSLLVLLINFRLVIAQSQPQIRLLGQLGYKSSQMEEVLNRRIWAVMVTVLVASMTGILIGQYWFSVWIESQGFPIGGYVSYWVWIAALVLSATIFGANQWAIRRELRKILG